VIKGSLLSRYLPNDNVASILSNPSAKSNRAEYLLLTLLIASINQTGETWSLGDSLPLPITFESRRKKNERGFCPCPTNTGKIWFPILQTWLKASFAPAHVLYIAIDRTKWGCINLLMISLIWDRRARCGNFYPRGKWFWGTAAISKCYRYSSIKQSYWGNSVKLGNWLTQKQVYFCVRLKQNEFVQLEDESFS